MRAFERNSANLAASLSFYGEPEERGGVLMITSPVSYSVFNIGLLTEPVSSAAGELDRRIRIARQHFEKLGRPWSFWVCEDLLPNASARKLDEAFDLHGLGCIADSPGMEAEDFAEPARILPPLEVHEIEDGHGRMAFARLVTESFQIPYAVAKSMYESEANWKPVLRVWTGHCNGQAVCCAGVVVAAGAIGIYSVATLPAWRRRGMAEAIMRHAVSVVRSEGATGPLVLQSSPPGIKLYRALGFKRTTRYFVYATI